MTAQKTAPRKPWLAGLLQLITPGLGNLYSGRPRRALILFVILRILSFGSLITLLWLSGLMSIVIFLLFALVVTVFVVADGVRCAKAADPAYRLASYNRWYVYVLLVIGIAIVDGTVVTNLVTSRFIQAFNTPTPSMQPTILRGDRIIVDKIVYSFSPPVRGDLVVYHPPDVPSATYVKRIVGLPGESIEIRNRTVLINGKEIVERYAQFASNPSGLDDSFGPTVIPPDSYFVLGDNRNNSIDSRTTGAVERTQVLGKVRTVYFSLDPDNGTIRWNRIGKELE
jgi:signal peptidase I